MTRHKKNGILSLLLALLPGILFVQTTVFAKTATPARDIRIIIDMSGSMKVNDPLNHRVQAVQLFSEVLPDNVYAGIWTFASKVNMLMKYGKVDRQWRKTAFKTAKEIHSHGLFTNIEKALVVASDEWYDRGKTRDKYLILLTDGYVDISKDAEKNKQSRKNIIDKILPDLKNRNITVHTIALSEHADHALLKKLSLETKGRFTVIKDAGALDRYFFKLFQSTTKPDTIPLKGNKFRIDKSVEDMTIVLFNKKHDSKLITPEKKVWTHHKHPASVKWVKSNNYEVITASGPKAGNWLVDAPIDPDNKIMVVTNLRLRVDKLPSSLHPGEPFNIRAYMTEDSKVVKKKEFINLLKVTSSLKKKDAATTKIVTINYQGNGDFAASLDTAMLENDYSLTITVNGPTFTREFQHDFTIFIPVAEVKKPVAVKKKPVKQMFEIIPSRVKQQLIKQKQEETVKENPVKVKAPPEIKKAAKKTHAPEPAHEPEKEEGTSWVLIGSVVFLLNVFFIVIGILTYKKLTKTSDNQIIEDKPAEPEEKAEEQIEKTGEEKTEVTSKNSDTGSEPHQEVDKPESKNDSDTMIPELTEEVGSKADEAVISGLEDIEDVNPEKEISKGDDDPGSEGVNESVADDASNASDVDTDVKGSKTEAVEMVSEEPATKTPEAILEIDIDGLEDIENTGTEKAEGENSDIVADEAEKNTETQDTPETVSELDIDDLVDKENVDSQLKEESDISSEVKSK
ncbi:MAG TPA: VWA domain-containing protein [Gammaproteobacteria bacterium]|nr:VWA domain-containing protein [Gammaproteobacteria bacterium]